MGQIKNIKLHIVTDIKGICNLKQVRMVGHTCKVDLIPCKKDPTTTTTNSSNSSSSNITTRSLETSIPRRPHTCSNNSRSSNKLNNSSNSRNKLRRSDQQ